MAASEDHPATDPCSEAAQCEAFALCELEYCICRRAGGGQLGGLGLESDPALTTEAQTVCGLTHGRVGKCSSEARRCREYRRNQYEREKKTETKHKGRKGPRPESRDPYFVGDCNPNFDPSNIQGEYDRPCID
ncbi:MAG: hypothetical protein MI747_23955 [Desulfobacterales bacterium]|nr:hypothetical protein [Desulfobacterales bacterium]